GWRGAGMSGDATPRADPPRVRAAAPRPPRARGPVKAHALRKPPIQTTPGGLLARMRVRKKLIVLHTAFSLVLAGTLLLALRPAIERVIAQAEMGTAEALALAAAGGLRAEAAN